jgi:hypothetical protein
MGYAVVPTACMYSIQKRARQRAECRGNRLSSRRDLRMDLVAVSRSLKELGGSAGHDGGDAPVIADVVHVSVQHGQTVVKGLI